MSEFLILRKRNKTINYQRFISPLSPVDVLINKAQAKLGIFTKTETINRVGATAVQVCRIRSGLNKPSAEFILKFYDATGISIEEIRETLKLSKLL